MSIAEDDHKTTKKLNSITFTINEVVETRVVSDSDVFISGTIGRVPSKDTSSILIKLMEILPLHHFGLGHLKRARKYKTQDQNIDITEVFLCPTSYYINVPVELTSLLLSTETYQISRIPPETANEFSSWGKHWPIQYRPNETIKKFMKGLPQEDLSIHSKFMSLAHQDGIDFTNSYDDGNDNIIFNERESKFKHLQCPGAIMVNPQTNKVVMTSFDAYKYLKSRRGSDQAKSILLCPLSTPTMLTIDGVAACVRGEIDNAEDTPENYVCCGLDLYVVREPDIMDSMALVHSRIRHVYYTKPDDCDGGLGSCFNIHSVRSLNHHYRVFHCIPDDSS